MFVLTRNVTAAKQAIATLLATALVLWASGVFSTAQAANVTFVSDVMTDTAPAADSDHTIDFVAPSGVNAGETMTVTFPAGFDLTGVTEDDVDLELDGVDEPTDTTASGATWGVAIAGQTVTITSGTATIGGTASITIKIGTNADGSGAGANQITNPTPAGGNESYEIDIAGTMADSGHTRVVILSTVLVTAEVQTVFEFLVYGNGASEAVNGTSTTLTSSSTTIPFGVLTAGEIETLSQDLTVETNARNGFVVTVNTDGAFESTTGADIDVFDDGVISTTPATWSSPANTLGSEDTYGHWGITSEDTDTVGNRAAEFGSNEWVGLDTTPVPVFAHNGPSDAVAPGIGSTTVGFQVEITPLQEAGDDYETVLTYVATPTF